MTLPRLYTLPDIRGRNFPRSLGVPNA